METRISNIEILNKIQITNTNIIKKCCLYNWKLIFRYCFGFRISNFGFVYICF
jgi:hypothetical protein